MLFLLLLCCVTSFFATAFLVRYGRGHAHSYGVSRPQRFHMGHVPRLGGIAMLVGCTIGWAWMVLSGTLQLPNLIRLDPWTALSIWIVTLIPVAGGILEDITQRLRASFRMLLTVVGAVCAVAALGLTVPRLGMPGLDGWWGAYHWLGIGLAVFAISGLPHAFNLIDGYNGLAGTVALICGLAVAYVSVQVGDRQLAAMMLALAGATTGFLVWNYPRGLIFAGDGGAYFWGVVLAIVSLVLVQRHAPVSPWFPVLLLIYPIWETFFSIFRKLKHGISPGVADALHFHQLIYRRVVREVFHDDIARRMLIRNNRTAPYLWAFTTLTVVPAALFWYSTPILMGFTALFVVTYAWAYSTIVRFRVQRYLPGRRR
jgi:UDP-GlcNAc:undecaprenyl-phosphate/decaprenyl-phosphate GlcNAc-1-phosphate transferase